MITRCLACRSKNNHRLHAWDAVPLSVVGLSKDEREARAQAKLTMDLRRCAMCGHVFHVEFDYAKVPYATGSNLVFNAAKSWLEYQRDLAREWIERYGIRGKRVLEIGCGDGTFLQPFLAAGNTCVAFEPGPEWETATRAGVTVRRELFRADALAELRPDFIICRHVIEHLDDPLEFLESIALACDEANITPTFLGEVPQIDKALEQARINDFLYEHVSNFTFRSFRTLFERAGFEIEEHASRYDQEVVTIVAAPTTERRAYREESQDFRARADESVRGVRATIEGWAKGERKVALWGGTGKGAAAITMFGLNADLCPIVVDSDPRKVGACVPGTGQRIESPEKLVREPVDAIVVCTQWRAKDIAREARTVWNLGAELFVIERGALVPLEAA